MEWHVWDFPDDIWVKFTNEFRTWLYGKLKEICKTNNEIAKRLDSNKSTIGRSLGYGFRYYRKSFTSIKLIRNIIKVFGNQLSKDFLWKLERNIMEYRGLSGYSIRNPILPIRESPKFYSIVFHMIGDGNASPRHTAYYSNKCRELIAEFVKNLQIFGNVRTNFVTRDDNLTYAKFPRVVMRVLSHLLKVEFVRTNHFPNRIFTAPIECKSEAIKAFIDDEGCVSTSFVIIQKSKNILIELKSLLESLGIRSGKICNYSGIHQLYISKYSYRRFRKLIKLTHPKKNRRLEAKIKELKY